MRRVILFYILVLTTVFLGIGQEVQLNRFIDLKNGDIPSSVLLSNDYLKRVKHWEQLQVDNFFGMLKSGEKMQKLDSIVTKNWLVESQVYENQFKYEYTFNEEIRNVGISVFSWDTLEYRWIISEDISYFFNGDGNVEQVDFIMDFGLGYKKYTRVLYGFEDSLLQDEIILLRYEETDPWDEQEQTAYSYDANNRLIRANINDWDYYEEEWIDDKKIDYTYDEYGNVISELGYSWGGYSKVWFKKEQTEYAYDENNNLIETIDFVPGWESDDFIEDNKETRIYNDTLELKKITKYSWSFDLDNWLMEEKFEYSQAEPENLMEVLGLLWNGSWNNSSKDEFKTTQGLYEDDILYWEYVNVYLPVYSFDSEVSDLVENFEWINNEWSKISTINYYFSPEITVGIDQNAEAVVRIYPNPVIDFLKIEIGNSEKTVCIVRDILGRKVLQKNVWQSEQLNLASYKPGIYFVELHQNGNRIFSGKVLKR